MPECEVWAKIYSYNNIACCHGVFDSCVMPKNAIELARHSRSLSRLHISVLINMINQDFMRFVSALGLYRKQKARDVNGVDTKRPVISNDKGSREWLAQLQRAIL